MAQDTSRRVRNMTALGGAVLLGTTFLTAPVSAQSVEELRAQMDALQQRLDQIETRQVATPVVAPAQAVTAGDFPGAIKLPGTNTSFKVGGYVKFDYQYSTNQGLGDSFSANAIAVPGTAGEFSNGQSRLLAKQTRFNIQTRTPSDLGQIKTFIEGDFTANVAGATESISNSTPFRLRQAYGTIGNLLLGQTWSNFMHLGALADTIDFGGPAGAWFARQGQIRYTIPFSGGWKIDLSVENPQSIVVAGLPAGVPAAAHFGALGQNDDRIPDFTGKVTFGGDWGFVSLAGMVGAADINSLNLCVVAGGVCQIIDDTELGFAVHAGARIGTWGKDSIFGTISYNDGLGRTVVPFFFPSYYVNTTGASPSLESIDWFSGTIGYEHWWTDNLYSNAVFGITDMDVPGALTPAGAALGIAETVWTVHVNLWWAPVPRVRLGIEWMMGQREFDSGPGFTGDDDNSEQRFQFGAQFSF